VTGTEKEKVS